MRTTLQRWAALRVVGLGSLSMLMLGSLGCSGSPGTEEEENTGTENAALTSGSVNWTLATTSQGGEGYQDVKVQPNGNLVAAALCSRSRCSGGPPGGRGAAPPAGCGAASSW